MGYFFETFPFEADSRMTGIWHAALDVDPDQEVAVMATLVQLGRDQHDELESDFLASQMPFHFGGFHGVGPDGHPWAVMLQMAPASAAKLVDGRLFWPLLDGLDRALHYNWEASVVDQRVFIEWDLRQIYSERGVHPRHIEDWDAAELLLGLLAECCYVPLERIVAGRITQCALPDLAHDCTHDVFSDVFAAWMQGLLTAPEPPRRRVRMSSGARPPEYWWPKKTLRQLSKKKLRRLALRCLWDDDEVEPLSRQDLIALLSTPHWKNEHEDANVTYFPPTPKRLLEEDED